MGKILVRKIKTYHVSYPNDLKMTFEICTFFSTTNKRKIYKRIIYSLLIQILVIFSAKIF